ncbi:GTP cyclohydrolase I [Kitasatospora sp. NPDC048296]|uniref:GTP cyclohydrolase I n=1 Tax=Kitasatospora sp. NPDC048296 TaxID=3364048 RepID=UPI00371971B4
MTAAVPGSVLAAIAHPDDAELWAGATLALHARCAAVTIAVPHRDEVRDAETRKGAAALGVSIAYVPGTDVLGLSKLVRHLEAHTHALQLQERITHDVAHDLAKAAGTDDVAVFTVGEHLCMSMRGVKATSVHTTTMCRLGRTESDPDLAARIERLALPVRP